MTEERQAIALNGIGLESAFRIIGRYWVVSRNARDDERSRFSAFVVDWLVDDPCFSEW